MAGSNDHIPHGPLFDLSRLDRPYLDFECTEEENAHVRACELCQRILAVFARQFPEDR